MAGRLRRDKDQGECRISTRNWAQVCSLSNSKGRHVDSGGAYPGQHLCFWNALELKAALYLEELFRLRVVTLIPGQGWPIYFSGPYSQISSRWFCLLELSGGWIGCQ